MKLKKLAAGLGTLGLLAVAAPSFAIPTLNLPNPGGLTALDPFGGFDYVSYASSVTNNLNFDNNPLNPIVTTYLASASKYYKGRRRKLRHSVPFG